MTKNNVTLGQILATPNALSQLADEDVRVALRLGPMGYYSLCARGGAAINHLPVESTESRQISFAASLIHIFRPTIHGM